MSFFWGGGGGRTNERPGTDHVTSGQMRALKKNCTRWRRQTDGHGDSMTEMAQGSLADSVKMCFPNYSRLTNIFYQTISTPQTGYCFSFIYFQCESCRVSVNHLRKQRLLHTGYRKTASFLYG